MLVVTCISLLPSGLGTRLGDMECCVPSELNFEAADSSLYVIVCQIIHFKGIELL